MASEIFSKDFSKEILSSDLMNNSSDFIGNLKLLKHESTLILNSSRNAFFFIQEADKWPFLLEEIFNVYGWKRFLIDFEQTFLVTSSTLSQLIWFRDKLLQKHCQISLCALNSDAKDLFHRTCLNQIFEIFNNKSEAFS